MGQPTAKITKAWPGTRCVKDRNGDARYWYVKPIDGSAEVRLRAEYGTLEWEREYLAARGGAMPLRRVTRKASLFSRMTLVEAIERYRQSTIYRNLAKATIEKREATFATFLDSTRRWAALRPKPGSADGAAIEHEAEEAPRARHYGPHALSFHQRARHYRRPVQTSRSDHWLSDAEAGRQQGLPHMEGGSHRAIPRTLAYRRSGAHHF